MLCIVEAGVSYDTDIDLARRLMLEEANNCPHRLETANPPWARVISNSDFSIVLRVHVWVVDIKFTLACKIPAIRAYQEAF